MAEQKIAKPSFREKNRIVHLDDVGLSFNSWGVGPMNFYGLRNADYDDCFRMPTMPELVSLVYASVENQDYVIAKEVIKTLRQRLLTGNTASHSFPEGMFVEDNPEIKNKRIVTPTYKELEKRLGSYEERGVVFSDDKSVRFTPYNFKSDSQSASYLSKNTGVIAIVNGEKNAEKLAKASEHWKRKPYFGALSNIDLPQTRVAGLISGGGGVGDFRLFVEASGSESFGNRYSFAVKKAQKVLPQKNK